MDDDKSFPDQVRERRNHTPWAEIDLRSFARLMAVNGGRADAKNARRDGAEPSRYSSGKNDFLLKVEPRPGTDSGVWYTVRWTGVDGLRHHQAGQNLDNVLWKAAQAEMDARERAGREVENDGADDVDRGE